MSKQTKRVDSLSTGTLGIRMSLLELESRKLEPVVKKDDNVDMECCASDRSQNDPLTFSNSCQKSKRSHQKRKLAVRADRKISLKDAAHAYLQLWHSDRSSWQFRKKIQFWLLKNMYAKDQVFVRMRYSLSTGVITVYVPFYPRHNSLLSVYRGWGLGQCGCCYVDFDAPVLIQFIG